MAYKTDIGQFSRKVSFCVPTTTKSSMGAPSKTYTHSFYAYMSRQVVTTGEQFVNSRLVSPTRYKYTGHNNSAINETLQIVDNSIKYNILSVERINHDTFIEVIAEKIQE